MCIYIYIYVISICRCIYIYIYIWLTVSKRRGASAGVPCLQVAGSRILSSAAANNTARGKTVALADGPTGTAPPPKHACPTRPVFPDHCPCPVHGGALFAVCAAEPVRVKINTRKRTPRKSATKSCSMAALKLAGAAWPAEPTPAAPSQDCISWSAGPSLPKVSMRAPFPQPQTLHPFP